MKRLLTLLAVTSLMFSTLLTAAPVHAQITIDGVISPGEWDAYYLGTSVTTWQGGMSVDVYGFADDTYLYAAYVADTSQPGWSIAQILSIPANFYFKTPQSASWPDPGYTIISIYGDGFGQTDGTDWYWPDGWANTDPSVFTSRGIVYSHYPAGSGNPTENVAELMIPLSLLTYAGTDGIIRISGQYWQYDWAEPFYVTLPPPPPISVYVDIKPGSWPNPIKTSSKGVFAVAICGTEDFDVMTIDPATVGICYGTATPVAPLRWSYEDVATPYTDDGDGGHALGADGYLDLVLIFDTQAVVATTLSGHIGETIPLIITGNLYPAFDGTPILGQDWVWVK